MEDHLKQEVKNLHLNLPSMLLANLKYPKHLLMSAEKRVLTPQEIDKAYECFEKCYLLAKTELSILLWKIENIED